MKIAVLLITFLVIIAIGQPISVAMGISSLFYVLVFMHISPVIITQQIFGGMNKFSLLAVPFFILAGAFMENGGISKRLVNFAKSIFGSLPGGLAIVVVVASALFAAMTGSAVATCAAVGGIMFPVMKAEGYDEDFTYGLQCASGVLGPLIPPSLIAVVYGVATGVSITDLLLGGALPGFLLAGLYIVVAVIISKKEGWRGTEKFQLRATAKAFVEAIPALLVPVIILGGIYTGLCTATEAAALATLYSLLIGMFLYRELTLKKIVEVTLSSMKQMGGLIVIVGVASAFAWVLTMERIPYTVANLMVSVAGNRYAFLGLVAILTLFVGCFIDTTPAVLILGPILSPAAASFGIDLIHFGVFLIFTACLGMITPPVGCNLFVVSAMTERPMQKFVRRMIPFFIVALIGMICIGLIPALSTWLPGLSK